MFHKSQYKLAITKEHIEINMIDEGGYTNLLEDEQIFTIHILLVFQL